MKHISQLFSAAIIMIVCFLSVTQSNAQNCPTDIFPTNIPWSYGMVPCQTFGFCKRTYSRCCDPISGVHILTLISAESTGTCDPNNTICKSICY